MNLQAWILLSSSIVAFAQNPSLGMEEAVASALAGQPLLKAAEEQAKASEARVDQARWDRVGKIETLSLITPRQKVMQAELLGNSLDLNMQRRYAFQATYTQPLWTWGALTHAQHAAECSVTSNKMLLTRAQQQTAFETRRAYLQASLARESVRVTQQNLEQQKAFLETAKVRVSSGAAARLDLLKAELSVANAQSDWLEAENRERLAREALVTVSHDPRFRNAALTPLVAGESEIPQAEEAIAQALRQRPDLASLKEQAAALAAGEKAARAAGLPSLSFRASLLQQDDRASHVFRGDSRALSTDFLQNHQTYQVGFVLNWDATGPQRARAKVAELRANEQAVRHASRSSEDQVALEIRNALYILQESRVRAMVQASAVAVAEEHARVARLAYREGMVTSVELQGAETALTASRFNRLRAVEEAVLAQVTLRFAMGE